MKKLFTLIALLLLVVGFSYAQHMVSGVITGEDGEPLIGASVLVKGATVGTVADFDGSYSVTVPEGSETLVFSYTGYTEQEIQIGTQDVINVVLVQGLDLGEVVVTALGIKREKKALGYSVQELGGADLTVTQSENIVRNLAGNVAGVQVLSSAGSSVGGSAKIRIRGVNGLSGGDPLFVVDGTPISNSNFSGTTAGSDFGNLAGDINPEDVETLSVLKGPSATALYGNRAKNGVVLITLKKGARSQGIGVTASSSLTFDNVYVLPEYQDEYAGGYAQDFIPVTDPVDGREYMTLNYSADESWGPRMDGTQYRPWWSWFPGAKYGKTVPLTAQPNNVRDFFDQGVNNQNAVSITGGGESTSYRLSYANVNQRGVFPNSKFNKNSISVGGSHDITSKLTISTSINVVANQGRARPEFGYNGKNPATSFNQWFQRQIDMDQLRDYLNEDGTMKSWNIRSATNLRPLYWDNPFYIQYRSFNTDSRSRYYGNINLNYKLSDHISIKGAVHRDDYTQRIEYRNGSESLDPSFYSEFVANGREDNYELIMSYNQVFGDFSVDANLGGNQRVNDFHRNIGSTVGGLNTPNLFTLGASTDRPNLTSFISEKKVNSVFAAANFGYKNWLYLGATIRNDWSSALPVDNNSYMYPSVSGSIVFSEFMGQSSVLSFGKVRASWAQVGSDLDPYRINNTYNSGTPYGSTPSFNENNILVDPNLKPALSTSYEVGLDLRFLNERLSVDLTYYNQDSRDEILSLAIPGSTGYSRTLINAGLFNSQGYEITLGATPFDGTNFRWNFAINFAHNTSKVVDLYEDLENYKLADAIGGVRWGGLSVNAKKGAEWGTLIGGGYTYDATGNLQVSESGRFTRTAGKELGSILPDFTGGFRTGLSIYGFDVNAVIDFQLGGKFFSVSKMFNAYSGLGVETIGNNDKGNPLRDEVDAGGGVKVEGVTTDGTPVSTYVDAVTYFGRLFGFHERWIYDATYVKWRELSVGYTFPKSIIGNTPFRNLRLAAIARNPLLIHSEVEGIDPSEILPGANNLVFEERGGLPGTRSYGLKLNISL